MCVRVVAFMVQFPLISVYIQCSNTTIYHGMFLMCACPLDITFSVEAVDRAD